MRKEKKPASPFDPRAGDAESLCKVGYRRRRNPSLPLLSLAKYLQEIGRVVAVARKKRIQKSGQIVSSCHKGETKLKIEPTAYYIFIEVAFLATGRD